MDCTACRGLTQPRSLNVVEQQLLSALRETPPETDCSVSVKVLESLGFIAVSQQEQWLCRERAPREGKRWYRSGDRWEYCVQPPEEGERDVKSLGLPSPLRAATSQVSPRSIVVKPLAPLKRR